MTDLDRIEQIIENSYEVQERKDSLLAAFRGLREERDAAEAASEVLAQAAKNVVLDEICTCPENSPTCRMPELIEAVAAYRASKRKGSFRKE